MFYLDILASAWLIRDLDQNQNFLLLCDNVYLKNLNNLAKQDIVYIFIAYIYAKHTFTKLSV